MVPGPVAPPPVRPPRHPDVPPLPIGPRAVEYSIASGAATPQVAASFHAPGVGAGGAQLVVAPMPFLGPRNPAGAVGAALESEVAAPPDEEPSADGTEGASAPSGADDVAGRTGGDPGQPAPPAMALCHSA
eukprot:15456429-Alexandrium_andersonii.AAC.1